ncbi:MAG: YdcF family protein [Formosimonas sp.]
MMKRLFAALILVALLIVAEPIRAIVNTPALPHDAKADVAVVLGAATRNNVLSDAFKARIDYAIELYEQKKVKQLLFTGGFRDKDPTREHAEARVARDYALTRGVPARDILTEEVSTTTLENISHAQKLMHDAALKTAVLVSDEWHLSRALKMAQDQGMSALAAPTPYSVYQSWRSKAAFIWREVQTTWAYRLLGI